MPGADDEITYEALRNLQKKEERAAAGRPNPLPIDYYPRARAFLAKLEADLHVRFTRNPTGADTLLVRREWEEAKSAFEELAERRILKVFHLANAEARGESVDVVNLTKEERALFHGLVTALREGRRPLLNHTPPPTGPPSSSAPQQPSVTHPSPLQPAHHPSPITPPASSSAGSAAPAAPPPGVARQRVLVRVLGDIPTFQASDQRAYTLTAEDVVALPADAARALVKRERVHEIR
ncbi:MAG: hypothetical protein ACT4PT_01280 [Methanobacteriota archaeon]